MNSERIAIRFFLLFLVVGNCASGQYGAKDGNWPHHGGDSGSTKYSALDQINAENFNELEVLWRWESPATAIYKEISRAPYNMVATPLVIDGVGYVSTSLSQVASFDVETGETLWVYDPKSYLRGGPLHGKYQHRGVEYWTDGKEERTVIATGGRQLVSLDAKTGTPDPKFGDGGWVDLLNDLGRVIPPRGISHSAPTAIVNDTIIVGSLVNDGALIQKGLPGHIRAYVVRTGKFRWRFHTIPQEGEFGIETWENDSWKSTGNTNCWSMMSVDEELGYVYLPIGAATSDYYGGHRHGDNLFSQSILCLNVNTGERVWHFQAIHHDLWDYDLPAAPVLMDIVVDGKPIKALAQISKQAFTYVLDRATGEPVWPIEERAVPTHPVAPGEKASPTQPFPTKPPAFDRQGSTEDDVIDFTPELYEAALKIYRQYQTGPLYTPPIPEVEGGKLGTILVPGNNGGGNWPGASTDPETGMFYVQSQSWPLAHLITKPRDPSRTDLAFHDKTTLPAGPEGLPLLKGPYKQLTAIDMNKGEIAWQKPIGRGPADHPAIKHLNLDDMGNRGAPWVWAEGGVLVTKTLLIMPQVDVDEANNLQPNGSWLFAFDKATGKELGKVKFDTHLHSSPMTAMHKGRQYILFSAGGSREEPAGVVAIGLPNPK